MDYDSQLKLQAYLDGELSEAEAREAANRLAQDREAVALHSELRNMRQAMVGQEVGITLPESREFFWSKIEREILRQQEPEPEPAREWPSLLAAWRRLLVPAVALATLVLAGLLAGLQFGLVGARHVPEAESNLADPQAFTYRDYDAQTTLVWLSYPAENEVAANEPP